MGRTIAQQKKALEKEKLANRAVKKLLHEDKDDNPTKPTFESDVKAEEVKRQTVKETGETLQQPLSEDEVCYDDYESSAEVEQVADSASDADSCEVSEIVAIDDNDVTLSVEDAEKSAHDKHKKLRKKLKKTLAEYKACKDLLSESDRQAQYAIERANEKLKEAAAAVREANRLSEEAGLPALVFTQFIAENYKYDHRGVSKVELDELTENWREQLARIDVHELESELDSAGWNTSSSYC